MTLVEQPPAQTVLRAEVVADEAPAAVVAQRHRDWQRPVGQILVATALLVAWTFTYLFALSGLAEHRAQRGLYARLRSELAQGTAPVRAPIAPGAPVALLDVPAAGIQRLVVVEGTAPGQLQDGPGHLRSTVLPGQAGISVLMGRARSFGGAFAGVHRLRAGDVITVTTGQGRFRYRVIGAPEPHGTVHVPATTAAMLTLVTSRASGWLSGVESSGPLYVNATLLGKAQPRSGTLALASGREQPMAGDYTFGTVAALVLGLQLCAAVFAGLVWARARWSPTLAYLIGVPVLLASLWLASDVASRLLPNLM
jgi:sortase A